MSKITQEMNESVFYMLLSEEFAKIKICSIETEKRLRIEYQLMNQKQKEQLESFWSRIVRERIRPILPPDSDKLLTEVHIIKSKKMPVHRIIFDFGLGRYDFIVYRSTKKKCMTVALKMKGLRTI